MLLFLAAHYNLLFSLLWVMQITFGFCFWSNLNEIKKQIFVGSYPKTMFVFSSFFSGETSNTSLKALRHEFGFFSQLIWIFHFFYRKFLWSIWVTQSINKIGKQSFLELCKQFSKQFCYFVVIVFHIKLQYIFFSHSPINVDCAN